MRPRHDGLPARSSSQNRITKLTCWNPDWCTSPTFSRPASTLPAAARRNLTQASPDHVWLLLPLSQGHHAAISKPSEHDRPRRRDSRRSERWERREPGTGLKIETPQISDQQKLTPI